MPDKNPFFTSDAEEHKANLNRTAREKLFADLGLPVATHNYDAVFEEKPEIIHPTVSSPEDSFISPTASINTTEDDDQPVDAIFQSTAEQPAADHVLFAESTVEAIEPASSQHEQLETEEEPLFTDLTEEAKAVTEASIEDNAADDMTVDQVPAALAEGQFENIVAAYQDLQKKLEANQLLINAERESIAELRNHMRQRNALGHEVAENTEGLNQGRQLIQTESCANLIQSINQVNDMIQHDGQQAAQLLSPIKAGIEVLELRVKHVNAIENLLTHMREGMALQKQLTTANQLVQDLGKFLGVNRH